MSNETIKVWFPTSGTLKTLESNGNAIPNNAVVQADDATYVPESEGNSYPDAQFVLVCSFGTAPAESMSIGLYAQLLAADGTNNTQPPEASRPGRFIGSFVVDNVTGTQTMVLDAENVPRRAAYYLHNNNTGQQVNAGWTLKVTASTFKPAA